MTKNSKNIEANPVGVFGRDLPLHRWRSEIARMRGAPGVEWALRMARFETDPVKALRLMDQYASEIPEEVREVFVGAAARLAHHVRAMDPALWGADLRT